MSEMLYEFIAKMIDDNVGHEGLRYFPFIFTLFMFILFGNLLGMIPYCFTFTSHIIVTFGMSIVIFVGVTFIGLCRHGLHFLSLFVPHGVPMVLLVVAGADRGPVLFHPADDAVDPAFRQYDGRPHHARRSSRVSSRRSVRSIFFPACCRSALDVALIFLELLVAVLQAYVFAILTWLYLGDAIHLH